MLDIITNPITLLCLTIVFMLVSFLFFYFKRTISALEKGQMEQARILQTFISNVDMSRGSIPYQHFGQMPQVSSNIPFQQHGGIDHETPIDDLIHVSDGENAGDEDSEDEDSEDEDSEDEDSEDEDSEDEDSEDEDSEDEDGQSNTITTENAISPNEITEFDSEIIELDTNVNDSLNEGIVKVIQLDNNSNLEEILESSLQDLEKIMSDDDDNDNDSDSDSGSDSDDQEPEESVKNMNDMQIHKNKDIDASNHELLYMDFKSLSVKILRQMAIDKKLSTEEDKLNKKELIKLLEAGNK